MFLTHCMMGWTALAVLSVSVPAWSSMKVTQPYRVVSTSGTAEIHCIIHPPTPSPRIQSSRRLVNPLPNLEELRVTLLRGLHGSQKICSQDLNASQQQENADGGCAVQIRDGAVEVALSGLTATHTDIYRCEIQILYPPPYRTLTGNGTLLHVLGSSHCPAQGPQRRQSEEEEESDEIKAAASVPVVLLVIAIICVLIIIIILQTLQCERGRRERVRVPPNVLLHKVDAVPFSSGSMI